MLHQASLGAVEIALTIMVNYCTAKPFEMHESFQWRIEEFWKYGTGVGKGLKVRTAVCWRSVSCYSCITVTARVLL